MKVLITGATSTIGIALANRLRNEDLFYCVRKGSRIEHLPTAMLRYCDLSEPEGYVEAIKLFKPDVVYHLAWWGSVRDREEAAQITLNVPVCLEIARACRDTNSALVFAGSLAEYDNPLNPYSLAKRCAGELMQMYCQRELIPFAHARIATVYGQHDDERHLIPRLLYADRHITKAVNLTDGYERWDFIHTSDVAEALVWLPGLDGVYDIGTGKSTSIRELVDTLHEINTFRRPPVVWGTYPSVRRSDKRANTGALYKQTGWYAKLTLKEGLKLARDEYQTPRKAEPWMQ